MAALRYTELEYSFQATNEAANGNTYCFRVYDQNEGRPIDQYNAYPQLTITSNPAGLSVYGEAGTIIAPANGGWATLTYNNTYTSPVVVGTSNTHNGESALVFEARNVGTTSAEVRLCESEG